MFQLHNFSILTDVQLCTEGWGGLYTVNTGPAVTRDLYQRLAAEDIGVVMQPPLIETMTIT